MHADAACILYAHADADADADADDERWCRCAACGPWFNASKATCDGGTTSLAATFAPTFSCPTSSPTAAASRSHLPPLIPLQLPMPPSTQKTQPPRAHQPRLQVRPFASRSVACSCSPCTAAAAFRDVAAGVRQDRQFSESFEFFNNISLPHLSYAKTIFTAAHSLLQHIPHCSTFLTAAHSSLQHIPHCSTALTAAQVHSARAHRLRHDVTPSSPPNASL